MTLSDSQARIVLEISSLFFLPENSYSFLKTHHKFSLL